MKDEELRIMKLMGEERVKVKQVGMWSGERGKKVDKSREGGKRNWVMD